MGFNSFQFILVFLPLCFAGFVAAHWLLGWVGAYAFLAVASLVFYAQMSLQLASVLVVSVLANYAFGLTISARRAKKQPAGSITIIAIALNLIALGYFKYSNFFIDIASSVSGSEFSHLDILVPVGVSFFTFTQIGYLIEMLNGSARPVSFPRYALFATFFPCVTAGPLLLQRDFFGQMDGRRDKAFNTTALAVGLTMFGIGLFKKVIFADSMAPYADVAFDGVALGAAIAPVEAWVAALAYSFQLYFDFSGYSDMAVGLGFMFGLKLPLNFNSPFKASSISDFWRRWHMTMTRFFTTFLFTPMAMKNSRRAVKGGYSSARRWLVASALPVFYTFLLAGIWHGAGYTFIVYGALHGLALAVDHGWRHFKMPSVGREIGWVLTMLVVITGLVIFRAPDLSTATTILASMWGVTTLMGVVPTGSAIWLDVMPAAALIFAYGVVVLVAPNSQQILRSTWVSSDPLPDGDPDFEESVRWSPNATWAVIAAVIIVIGVTSIGGDTGFLYYKF